ncbi:hypothetical protein ACHAWO_013596 [Cyclotella atomus]|uniref:Uncharacterized protein n=1 Tax=Cyclotella atomus TaxID=382360 RepID=A0ABD3PT34_9STRA
MSTVDDGSSEGINSVAELVELLCHMRPCEDVSCDDNLQVIVQQIESQLPCDIEGGFSHDSGLLQHQQYCANSLIQRQQQSYANVDSRYCIICNILELQHKARLVKCHMGCMAQCRGARGDELRDAGAISAVFGILWRLMLPLHNLNMWVPHYDRDVQTNDVALFDVALLLPSTAPRRGLYSERSPISSCTNHLKIHRANSLADSIALDALHLAALDLTILCMGALRDLSCGSALSRSAILEWTPPRVLSFEYICNGEQCLKVQNGIHILCAYVLRYHELNWQDILMLSGCSVTDTTAHQTSERGKKELRLLTNALGAIRNTSHSTPENCQAFFDCGLTDLLVWRLSPDLNNLLDENNDEVSESTLDPRHWREAKYRTAGSLINLAEKCPSVAHRLGSDRQMILLLIETWGGTNAVSSDPKKLKGIPLLHLGLAAILHAANGGALDGGLDDIMARILEKESIRKKMAQKKEEERKSKLNRTP